jgi:hypothetical protein
MEVLLSILNRSQKRGSGFFWLGRDQMNRFLKLGKVRFSERTHRHGQDVYLMGLLWS